MTKRNSNQIRNFSIILIAGVVTATFTHIVLMLFFGLAALLYIATALENNGYRKEFKLNVRKGLDWVREEKKKPRSALLIHTKDDNKIETEWVDPHYSASTRNCHKYTSLQNVERKIDRAFSDERVRVGDRFIPMCDIRYIEIETEKLDVVKM